MITDIDRQKLRELCERATPGPWTVEKDNSFLNSVFIPVERDGWVICEVQPNGNDAELIESDRANAAFIAAARTALPAILDLTDEQAAEIAELKAENARLKEVAKARGVDMRDDEVADALTELQVDIATAHARIAALDAQLAEAVANEREECAKVADAYADENIRMAGDTIPIDPVLKNGDVSSIAFARSEDPQIHGRIHSAMYHTAANISAAIRARSEQEGK